ncbi:hypothetical protein V8F20_005752 [Naviculisporaceae sp. PSN 640]
MATFKEREPRAAAQAKRKFTNNSDNHNPNPKKQRVIDLHNPASHPSVQQSPYLEPYRPLVDKLKPRYQLKHMSVMPSTKVSQHVDKALNHLSRFNLWDQAVLPGVIFLTAKSVASVKLITIIELVRRRIGEGGQKWYQYNVLSETEDDRPPLHHQQQTIMDRSVVEDTYMAIDDRQEREEGENDDDDNDDYFETSVLAAQTIHEQATSPPTPFHKRLMAIFISRVPLDEIKNLPNIGYQTNEHDIADLRKKV